MYQADIDHILRHLRRMRDDALDAMMATASGRDAQTYAMFLDQLESVYAAALAFRHRAGFLGIESF